MRESPFNKDTYTKLGKIMKDSTLTIPNPQYSSAIYQPEHWAVNYTKDDNCVAFVADDLGNHYAIKINPTDSRGYRSLVVFVGNESDDLNVHTTFNRPYSMVERMGLAFATNFAEQMYRPFGMFTQIAEAGNNSHRFDPATHVVTLGNDHEPCMLHAHVWGRGDPTNKYIPEVDVPLGGPVPGVEFHMTGGIPMVPGNNCKTPWPEGELEKTLDAFRTALDEYIQTPEYKAVAERYHIKDVEIYRPAPPNRFGHDPGFWRWFKSTSKLLLIRGNLGSCSFFIFYYNVFYV